MAPGGFTANGFVGDRAARRVGPTDAPAGLGPGPGRGDGSALIEAGRRISACRTTDAIWISVCDSLLDLLAGPAVALRQPRGSDQSDLLGSLGKFGALRHDVVVHGSVVGVLAAELADGDERTEVATVLQTLAVVAGAALAAAVDRPGAGTGDRTDDGGPIEGLVLGRERRRLDTDMVDHARAGQVGFAAIAIIAFDDAPSGEAISEEKVMSETTANEMAIANGTTLNGPAINGTTLNETALNETPLNETMVREAMALVVGQLRAEDLTYHFGPAELAVILPRASKYETAVAAERIIRALRANLSGADQDCGGPLLRFCAGVTAGRHEDPQRLAEQACSALEEARSLLGDAVVTTLEA